MEFLMLVIIYFSVFKNGWKKINNREILIKTLMYFYIVLVMCVTLIPITTVKAFSINNFLTSVNIIPFIDVINRYGDFNRQILLNIIMTIPFGFLLPLSDNKYKFFKVVVLTFIFSLFIEILQPILTFNRVADVTDLITNTFGGIIGYLIYFICAQFQKYLTNNNVRYSN